MEKVLCFDMYGTLCDTGSVKTVLAKELGVPGPFLDEINTLWRRKQLQYAYLVGLMERYRSFWEITNRALDYTLEYFHLDLNEIQRDRILEAYQHLEPFPSVPDTLELLIEHDVHLTVLSNGDLDMLQTLVENAGLSPYIKTVISAEDVQTFKPSPRVYKNAARVLERDLQECQLVSGNAWDVTGAASAGMGTIWVNRSQNPFEVLSVKPDHTVKGINELPDLLVA